MNETDWSNPLLVSLFIAAVVPIGAVILDRHLEHMRQTAEGVNRMLTAMATAAAEMKFYEGNLKQIADEMQAAATSYASGKAFVLPSYRPLGMVFSECRSLLLGITDDHQIIRDLSQCEFDLIHVASRIDQIDEETSSQSPHSGAVVANMRGLVSLALEVKERFEGTRSRTISAICAHPEHDRIAGLERLVPGGCGCRVQLRERAQEQIDP